MDDMRSSLATQAQDKATARSLAQSVFELARHQTAGPSEGERAGKLAQALAQGADVNARGAKKNEGQGSRPLHVAAVWAGPELIEAFLRSGADPNARRADGATPIHVAAARWDGAPLVELLARWGADLDALDKEGAPPLARAFGWRTDQNGFETARALLKAGASWPAQGVSERHDFRWKAAQSRDGEALAFMAKEGANLQAAAGSPSLWMALVRGPGPSWRVDAAKFEQCCQALDAAAVAGPSPLDSWRDDALCEALIHLPSGMQQRLARSIGDFSTLWAERERRLMSIFESRPHDHLRDALALGLDPTWRWASGSGLANVLCQAIGQSNYAFQAGAISLAASVGADLDEPDACGWRPLARALAGGRIQTSWWPSFLTPAPIPPWRLGLRGLASSPTHAAAGIRAIQIEPFGERRRLARRGTMTWLA